MLTTSGVYIVRLVTFLAVIGMFQVDPLDVDEKIVDADDAFNLCDHVRALWLNIYLCTYLLMPSLFCRICPDQLGYTPKQKIGSKMICCFSNAIFKTLGMLDVHARKALYSQRERVMTSYIATVSIM